MTAEQMRAEEDHNPPAPFFLAERRVAPPKACMCGWMAAFFKKESTFEGV